MSDAVPTTASSSSPAKRVIGNFELIEKVGQGGMGTVHRARQISLDREVALKILPPSIAKDAVFIERFQKEARASARLSHPNIVTGIDVGQDSKTGLWYFAMEFVDGPSLKDVLIEKNKLPEEEALRIIRDIVSALECLHQNGMVHRDIKPDNIMLTKRGDAKLADLGLAKDLKDDASLTQAGKAVGTPHYMAPEQVRGEVAELDIRADIYALGGTLFHLVTGRTPYTGETSAVIMAKHLTDPVPKAKDVNADVSLACSRLIERMMQKKKEDRVQTPKDLLDLLDKVKRNEFTTGPRTPISKHTTGPRQPVGQLRSGSKLPLIAAGVIGALALAGIVYALTGKTDPVVATLPPDNPGKNTPANTPSVKTDPPPDAVKKDPPETPAVTPPPDTAAKEAEQKKLQASFDEIQVYAKANPEHFNDIIKRFHQLNKQAKAARADGIAEKIDAAIDDVKSQRRTFVESAWEKIEVEIAAQLTARNYDNALKLCETLPPTLAELLKERAAERSQALHKEAEGKVAEVVRKVEDLSAAAQPEEALKVLAAAGTLVYAPTTGALNELKKRLETEIANAAELKLKREAMARDKAFEAVLAKFDKALREEKNLDAARQVATDAQKDPVLKSDAERVKALQEVAAALDAPLLHEAKALGALKGTTVDLQRNSGGSVKGTIKKVENGTIFVTMKQGTAEADFPVKLVDLNEASRTRLSPPFNPATDAQRIVMAVERLGRDDVAKAEEWLTAASTHPVAAHYLRVVAEKKQAEQKNKDEVAAAALYGEINLRASASKLSDAEVKLLQEKLTRFDTEFSRTQFAQEMTGKLAAIRKKLGLSAAVSSNPAGAAPTAAMQNGDFDKGLLEPWTVGRKGMDVLVTPAAARTGRGGLQFTGDRRGELIQPVTLEPGAMYTLSGYVRVAKGIGNNFSVDLLVRYGDEDDEESTSFRAQVPQLFVNQWVQLQTSFTAPASTAGKLILSARHDPGDRIAGEGRRGVIQFDDIVLTKVSGGNGRRSRLPPFALPPLLRFGNISFWVSPKTCPSNTDRELVGNGTPVSAGAAAVVPDGEMKVLGFDGESSLSYVMEEKPPSPAGTMIAWVKTKNPASTSAIFGRCGQRFDDVSLYIHNGKLLYSVDFDTEAGSTNAKFMLYSKSNLPADKWVMVAATWDGKNANVYINGEKDNTSAAALVPPRRVHTVVIGDNPTGSHEYLNGSVGGAMIFERALSDGEIKGLYVLGGIH